LVALLSACHPTLVASRPSTSHPLIGAWLSQGDANRRVVIFDESLDGSSSGPVTVLHLADGNLIHSTNHGWYQEIHRTTWDRGHYILLAELSGGDPAVVSFSLSGEDTVRFRYHDLSDEGFSRVPDPRIGLPLRHFNPIVGTWRSLNGMDAEDGGVPAGALLNFAPQVLAGEYTISHAPEVVDSGIYRYSVDSTRHSPDQVAGTLNLESTTSGSLSGEIVTMDANTMFLHLGESNWLHMRRVFGGDSTSAAIISGLEEHVAQPSQQVIIDTSAAVAMLVPNNWVMGARSTSDLIGSAHHGQSTIELSVVSPLDDDALGLTRDTLFSLGNLSSMTDAERYQVLVKFSEGHLAELNANDIADTAHWIDWFDRQPWIRVRYRFPYTIGGSYTREVSATVREGFCYLVVGTYRTNDVAARTQIRASLASVRFLR